MIRPNRINHVRWGCPATIVELLRGVRSDLGDPELQVILNDADPDSLRRSAAPKRVSAVPDKAIQAVHVEGPTTGGEFRSVAIFRFLQSLDFPKSRQHTLGRW